MTTYRIMATMSMDGYKGVYLVHESQTPLGTTRQSEIVYVNAYSNEAAKAKAELLLKSSVARTIDSVMDGPETFDTWQGGYRSVDVDENTFQIPQAVYDKITEQAQNDMYESFVRRGTIADGDVVL